MSGKKTLKRLLSRSEVPVTAATLLLGCIFAMLSSSFLSPFNLYNLTRSASLYMLMGLSQGCVILVGGGTNLSLGYIGAMSVVTVGVCMQDFGLPGFAAVIAALIVGILAGLLNGILVTRFKLNGFVVTLSTSFIFQGLVTGVSLGFPYTEIAKSFSRLGRGSVMGIPSMLILVAVLLVVVWYFFRHVALGRRMLATGGNAQAARMAAVDTDFCTVLGHIFSGVFAAIAGILTVSMNGAAQPSTGGDWMLYSVAVAVIGGTSLAGGAVYPFGIFMAGILITMIKNGLVMINANVYFELTYLGLILLGSLIIAPLSAQIREIRRRHSFRAGHK